MDALGVDHVNAKAGWAGMLICRWQGPIKGFEVHTTASFGKVIINYGMFPAFVYYHHRFFFWFVWFLHSDIQTALMPNSRLRKTSFAPGPRFIYDPVIHNDNEQSEDQGLSCRDL